MVARTNIGNFGTNSLGGTALFGLGWFFIGCCLDYHFRFCCTITGRFVHTGVIDGFSDRVKTCRG